MSYPSKLVKVITPIALAISLASCGGDTATFGKSSGAGGVAQAEIAKSLELSTSTRQLFSDGSVPIIITAIAKNENNNAISGADIVFSVDNDATIIADGEAEGSVKTASLTPGTPKNRQLIVTASSGTISKSITVDVVGTKVVIDGPSSITLNKDVPFVLKLTNGAEKPITNETITLTSSAGNTITTNSNFETDENGKVTFNLMGLQGGDDTLTANVLGVTLEKKVHVSSDEFVLSSSKKELNINTSQDIKLVWKKSGVVQANKDIYISTTRGEPQNLDANHKIRTNDLGEATVKISSSTAGKAVITAISDDGLSTTLKTEFIATTPAYLNTQADPTLIKPNGSSTIIAKIRDINDNPVKNKIIDFRLEDTVDGNLSASTAVTDSLGRASVSYTAGDSSSAKDGVIIKTFIHGYEGIVDPDPITLTVGSNALRIVLGHDHLSSSSDIFYVKKYGVIVTDSAGNPVKDQKVDFTIIPTQYFKGTMAWNGTNWYPNYTQACKSEDFDNDGKLDSGEDINRNGVLDPTHDASVTSSGVTDENGRIVVEVVFPKSRAGWSKQRITSSVVVAGTEFTENTDFILPVLQDDVGDKEVAPPNMYSPYGNSLSCDTVDGSASSVISSTIIVDALSGSEVSRLENNKWYRVSFVDNSGNVTNEKIKIKLNSELSEYTDIEYGPNQKSFRIIDKDPSVDKSGPNLIELEPLELEGRIFKKPENLYYKDDEAVTPPVDTTPPILTLNGAATMMISVDPTGAPFSDPGANAVDEKDGVMNDKINVIGHVNTDVVGTYTLIYKVTDSDGNSSKKNRIVIVLP